MARKKQEAEPDVVLRVWGADIDNEMSEVPRSHESVQAALDWLYAPSPSATAMPGREEIIEAVVSGLSNWDAACQRQNEIMNRFRQGNCEGARPAGISTGKVACITAAILALFAAPPGAVSTHEGGE
jgi:hypothetical protein